MISHRSRIPLGALLTLLPLVVALLVPQIASAGEEAIVDDILRIRNPEQPPQGIQRFELQELWKVGGDDEDLLLGLPTRVVIDPEDRICVLDAQLNQVHVFSPDGELVATRYREGEGPGEIQNPSDLLVATDGSMGVLQEFPGKVIRLDREGHPLPSLFPGGPAGERGQVLLMTGCGRGEHFVLCGMQILGTPPEQKTRQFLAAFDREGEEIIAYMEVLDPPRDHSTPRERDLLQPFILAWDVGPDGRVCVSTHWDRYELFVFHHEGKLDRIIEREYELWKRTPEERERLQGMFSAGEGGGPTLEVSETAPAIAFFQRGVQVTEDGELWVLPSRGNRALPEGVLARYDVFSPEGHFLRQVEFICPGDPWNDRLIVLGPDRVIRIRRFVDALMTSLGPGGLPPVAEGKEEDIPAVICYQATRLP